MVNVPYCVAERQGFYFLVDDSTGLHWLTPRTMPFGCVSNLIIPQPPTAIFTIKGEKPYRDSDLYYAGIDKPVDHRNCFGTLSFDGNPQVTPGSSPWFSSYPVSCLTCPNPEDPAYTDTVTFSMSPVGSLIFDYSYYIIDIRSKMRHTQTYCVTIDVQKSIAKGAIVSLGGFIQRFNDRTGAQIFCDIYAAGTFPKCLAIKTITVPRCTYNEDYVKNFAYSVIKQGWDRLEKANDPTDSFTNFNKAMASINPLSMNNIENLSQLRDITKMFPQLRGLESSAAVAANIYLWYRYVFQTTASDVSDLIGNISYLGDVMTGAIYRTYETRSSVSAGTTVEGNAVSVVRTTKVVFSPDVSSSSLESWHKMHALGLDLNLKNVWDLVPFSFVADWFFQIDDVLGGIDNAANVTKYNVDHRCEGLKFLTDVVTPYGTVTTTRYARRIFKNAPSYRLVLGSPTINNHWWDATALFVANMK